MSESQHLAKMTASTRQHVAPAIITAYYSGIKLYLIQVKYMDVHYNLYKLNNL